MSNTFNSPLFLSGIVGLYLSAFFATNNLTMLPGSSVVLIFLALTFPLVGFVSISKYMLSRIGLNHVYRAFVVFVCLVYLLIAIRHSIFELVNIQHFLSSVGGVHSTQGRFLFLIFVLFVASVSAAIFRKDSRVLASMFSFMILVAISSNAMAIKERFFGNNVDIDLKIAQSLPYSKFVIRPNIYFILADGYTNIEYLTELNFDSSGFTESLQDEGFRIYEGAFGNYHPTLPSMLAMLNMQQNYYVESESFGEVTKSGRLTIAGNNNLVSILKGNGYLIQYLHQGPYLLLHGCSSNVDVCLPGHQFAGAKIILHLIIPDFFKIKGSWEIKPVSYIETELKKFLSQRQKDNPGFTYIHLFEPGHSENDTRGTCNQSEQTAQYLNRVTKTNQTLKKLIEDITRADPTALIVLSGDHGPFLTNFCAHLANIDSLEGYRDRLGVMLAVRWPEGYEGKYDDQIKTTINVFRYVIGSLMSDDEELLKSLAPDDAYALGDKDILKIMSDGELLFPPERNSRQEMTNKYKEMTIKEYHGD